MEYCRFARVRKMDISNGPGVRCSLFVQGCEFKCKGCFNTETHDFNGGKPLSDEKIEHLMDLCGKDYIVGLSILGGEPLHPRNIDTTTRIAKIFKERYPEKSLWVWSGFLYDKYIFDKEITEYADVIVDGQFMQDLFDPTLKWKGSSNQRVIDVKKTKANNNQVTILEGCE